MDFQTYILDEVRQCVEKAKASYSRKPANGYTCDLCPIRSFDRTDRLRKHLEKSHSAMGPGAASSRVLRLALALYNIDQIHVSDGVILSFAATSGSYLWRAPKKIDDWITTGRNPNHRVMSGKAAHIDRHIMLVLSGKGPMYAVR